eukprot:2819021-Alexandrium_andersonii.AAC.1
MSVQMRVQLRACICACICACIRGVRNISRVPWQRTTCEPTDMKPRDGQKSWIRRPTWMALKRQRVIWTGWSMQAARSCSRAEQMKA